MTKKIKTFVVFLVWSGFLLSVFLQVFFFLCARILDNLPLVNPVDRGLGSPDVVYQIGYHVGLKGQYAGVSRFRLLTAFQMHWR